MFFRFFNVLFNLWRAVGQARELGGHYQHFTCGVSKQAKVHHCQSILVGKISPPGSNGKDTFV